MRCSASGGRLGGRDCRLVQAGKPDRIQPEILKVTPVASAGRIKPASIQGFMQIISTRQPMLTSCLMAALVTVRHWRASAMAGNLHQG